MSSRPGIDPVGASIFADEAMERMDRVQRCLLRYEREPHRSADLLDEMLKECHGMKGAAHSAAGDDKCRATEREAAASVVGYEGLVALIHDLESHLVAWSDAPPVDVGCALRAVDVIRDLARRPCDTGLHGRAAELSRELRPAHCGERPPGARSRQAVHRAPGPNPVAEDERSRDDSETARVARSRIDGVLNSVAHALMSFQQVDSRMARLRTALEELGRVRLPGEQIARRDINRVRNALEGAVSRIREAHRLLPDLMRQLDRHLHDLDDESSRLGVVPIEPLVGHLERAVRDAAKAVGRDVVLEVEGRGQFLERGLVEQLGTPLLHAVRNAVDHGIEPAGERCSLGKSPTGRLRIRFEQLGEALRIELSDDGRGVDLPAVRRRIGAPAEGLDDAQVLGLLMRTGLSTRDRVTMLSGRGLGLAAVADAVERLRGGARLTSRPGAGTTLTLDVPLTLSLIDGVVVRVSGHRLVIPSSGLVAVEREPWQQPSPPLAAVLGLSASGAMGGVVVLRGRECTAALAVDELCGQQEIVRRPLGSHIGRLPLVDGATILPDGHPALILDPRAVADACEAGWSGRAAPGGAARRRVLLVDDSATQRASLYRELTAAGFEVVLAEDGLGALERLRGLPCGAVVSDVQMQPMDGFGLLERCAGRVPVVLITAYPDASDELRARELGAFAYIVKDQGLARRVTETLGRCLARQGEPAP